MKGSHDILLKPAAGEHKKIQIHKLILKKFLRNNTAVPRDKLEMGN